MCFIIIILSGAFTEELRRYILLNSPTPLLADIYMIILFYLFITLSGGNTILGNWY